MRVIGVIAGKGIYPELFLRAAREEEEGGRLVIAGVKNETAPELERLGDVWSWFHLGQLGKVISYFAKEGVRELVMVGQMTPKNLYEFRPDVRSLAILARMKERNAETLFGAVADEFGKEGMRVLPACTFLERYMPGPGLVFGPKLGKGAMDDVRFGFRIAKEVSRLDIGQTVVVREGTVLAVEAFEGTNECLRRGAVLGKKKGVKLVKVSKPNQDLRFDIPVIGPDTVKNCVSEGISAIIIEAGKTLVLAWDEVKELARKHKLPVYAYSGEEEV